MQQARSQRGLYQGFGDANTRAFELVLVPVIFGLIGFAVGNAVGAAKLVALAFGVFGLVGVLIKAFYEYKAEMAKQDKGKPWAS